MQDSEFATFMSTYENSRIVLENNDTERKMSRMKEENKIPFRDRLKRPDKQLYVPRALRKTANENVVVKKDASKTVHKKLQKEETSLMVSQPPPVMEKIVCDDAILIKQVDQERDKMKIKNDKMHDPCLNDIPSSKNSSISSIKSSVDVKIVQDSTSDSVKNTALTDDVGTVINSEEPAKKFIENTAEGNSNDTVIEESDTSKGISSIITECSISSDLLSNDTVNVTPELKENKILTSHDDDKMKMETVNESKNSFQDSESSNALVHCDLKEKLQSIEVAQVQSSVVHANISSGNPEDSWETMFNDEGDCLDPKFMKELSDITGRTDLTVAKRDYSDYQPISRSAVDEYNNIVELFGFPVEFGTQDLTSAFSMFQEASYNIKWVDDCHALAIFSSPVIANQALHLNHPFIKVRPLSEGIKESKEKARYCARMLESHKPRPVTSAALARRLVSGALGLKVHASKEQRDIERNILKEAREKKKLKAKQKQDIWNGIVS